MITFLLTFIFVWISSPFSKMYYSVFQLNGSALWSHSFLLSYSYEYLLHSIGGILFHLSAQWLSSVITFLLTFIFVWISSPFHWRYTIPSIGSMAQLRDHFSSYIHIRINIISIPLELEVLFHLSAQWLSFVITFLLTFRQSEFLFYLTALICVLFSLLLHSIGSIIPS